MCAPKPPKPLTYERLRRPCQSLLNQLVYRSTVPDKEMKPAGLSFYRACYHVNRSKVDEFVTKNGVQRWDRFAIQHIARILCSKAFVALRMDEELLCDLTWLEIMHWLHRRWRCWRQWWIKAGGSEEGRGKRLLGKIRKYPGMLKVSQLSEVGLRAEEIDGGGGSKAALAVLLPVAERL